MSPSLKDTAANAWILIDQNDVRGEFTYPQFAIEFAAERKLCAAVTEGDWLAVTNALGNITRVGRVLRVRSHLERTIFYFDRLLTVAKGTAVKAAGPALPATGSMTRLQWSDFIAALPTLTGGTLDDVPLIGDQAYLRELLQLAVMDDLLGPANGPREQIVDMGVRDRYLVGKLAPREAPDGGIE